MAKEDAVEMFVGGLVLDPNTQAPVVVLKDEGGETCLPIWIGVTEATSIASAIKQVGMARPLTHDLMFDVLSELSITVQRVIITELRDSAYFAELVVSQGDKIHIFDSRPSDAIALAVRAAAPIFVSREVLEKAKISFDVVPLESQQQEIVEDEEQPDFQSVEKDKWKEILDDLDVEDFKYKM